MKILGNNMKVLVTGATGFIGSNLSRKLLGKGFIVRCLVRKESNVLCLRKAGFELVWGNLNDQEQLLNATKGISTVFHLAGSIYSLKEDELHRTNVVGTKNLLQACAQNKISKFIFLSSIAAMGPSRNGKALNEESPCDPITSYGRSKLEAEKIITQSNGSSHFPTIIVRAPTIYGPGVSSQSRVFYFLEKIRKGDFRIIGRGSNLISTCYIDDLISGLIEIHNKDIVRKTIYLLSSDKSHSLEEIAETIAKLENVKLPNRKIPVSLIQVLISLSALGNKLKIFSMPITEQMLKEITSDWIVDISKARKELAYNPKVNIYDGLKKTVQWYINEHGNYIDQ